MSLNGKLERVIELKTSPQQFYHAFVNQAFHIPTHAPDHIQAINVHEGDWDSHGHGSVKIWDYTIEGQPEVFKERVELDEENTTITLIGEEGHAMEIYSLFKGVYKLLPKDQDPNGSIANLSIQFEKRNPSVPPPDKYIEFMVGLTQSIDNGFAAANDISSGLPAKK